MDDRGPRVEGSTEPRTSFDPAERVRDRWRRSLADTLLARAEQGLLRELREGRGIDLVSNDYLGLADHPYIRKAMAEALAHEPAGSTGSRLLRGHRRVFADLEQRLARLCGTETALLFGSGWAANSGLVPVLVGPGDLVVSDALNHASLVDAIRLSRADKAIYPHQDLGALDAILAAARGRRRVLVVTESIFSMEGDLTPLVDLVEITERRGAALVVDEAHATGLFGSGAGRVQELRLSERVLATVHTGGKALGCGGAWIAGPRELRDVLVNLARPFVFSTAPLPVLAVALGAALDVIAREPHRRAECFRKSALLRTALRDGGVAVPDDATPIVPIVVGANERAIALQATLAEAGFDARAVRPPTVPKDTARIRVTVRAPIADEDLLRFAAVVARLAGRQA